MIFDVLLTYFGALIWAVVCIFWVVEGDGGSILCGVGWQWVYFGWWWVVVGLLWMFVGGIGLILDGGGFILGGDGW